jgi:hypothetical protein
MLVRFLSGCAALSMIIVSAGASQAQERSLTITPRAPVGGAPSAYTFTDAAGRWDRVPVSALLPAGPVHPETAGLPIRRGALVPNFVQVAPMRNVSIRGLRRGLYYVYFGTPEGRTVIINPSTMRVSRVVGRRV